MTQPTLDVQTIEQLRDIPDLTPVTRDYYADWNIRVYDRQRNACKNYLSPNRRDFYKILFITEGVGLFTLGINTYYIEEPTILFIHPNEIISWKNLADCSLTGSDRSHRNNFQYQSFYSYRSWIQLINKNRYG